MSSEFARLNVEIPEAQHERLNNLLPWGLKSNLVRALLNMLEESIKETGSLDIVMSILQGQTKIVLKAHKD